MDCLVLGLDPGIRCTGYGLVLGTGNQLRLLETGTIRPDPSLELSARLGVIYSRLNELIVNFCPHEAAVEDVFVSRNTASALKLGQARGAALVACASNQVPVQAYEPTLVKKSLVGIGRADKTQVAYMVGQLLGEKPCWPKDSSDALAVALCHLSQRRFKQLVAGCR